MTKPGQLTKLNWTGSLNQIDSLNQTWTAYYQAAHLTDQTTRICDRLIYITKTLTYHFQFWLTDACFCFWWFVCGLRKQPSDKFRVAAAARLKLFNQSSRGPDLIFKTQSGSDRKKMFDWFKPNQAKPSQIETGQIHWSQTIWNLNQLSWLRLIWFSVVSQFEQRFMKRKCRSKEMSDWLRYEPMEIILADTKSLIYLSKLLAILRNLAETFVLVQTFPIWINVL